MQPYNSVCEVLDARDFMQSYLDASFKGDVAQFALHTDRTEEEALEWYEADVFTPPADLSSAYHDRYKKALKEIMKQCKYTVGIPRKEAGLYSYTIDITVTPNNSLVKTLTRLRTAPIIPSTLCQRIWWRPWKAMPNLLLTGKRPLSPSP